MVYFKCRLSNAVVGFEYEWDIEEMRKHPQYDEVKDIPDGVAITDRNYSTDSSSTSVQIKVKKTTKEKVKEAK